MIGTDLAPFFRSTDFALSATVGVTTGEVLLDSPDLEVVGGGALSTEYAATMPADTFPTLARGDTMTIAATSYTVRHVQLLEDGRLKRAALSKV